MDKVTRVHLIPNVAQVANMPAHIGASSTQPLHTKIDSTSSVISFPPLNIPVQFDMSPPTESTWDKFRNFIGQMSNNREDVARNLQRSLSKALQSIDIDMRSTSVFAVSNLLFPGRKIINLKSAHLAQDLVLFGDVVSHLPTQSNQ